MQTLTGFSENRSVFSVSTSAAGDLSCFHRSGHDRNHTISAVHDVSVLLVQPLTDLYSLV